MAASAGVPDDPQSWWWRSAAVFARFELLWLAIAAPFLLFPNILTPFAALLILLIWPARRLADGIWTRSSPLNIPAALILLTALMGTLVSADYAVSEAKWWGIFLQVAIFFALLNSLRKERDILLMTAVLFIAGLGVVALGFIGTNWQIDRFLPFLDIYDRLPRIALGLPNSGAGAAQTFFNPRQIGFTLGMLLPLAFTILIFGKGWWLRLTAGLLALMGSVLLLLTSAIMGFLGLSAGLTLVAVWWRRWLIFLILPLLVALVFLISKIGIDSLLLTALDNKNALGIGVVLRIDIWSRALAMIGDMPFTGIGLNTFPLIQSHFYTGYAIGPEPHAHQLWLQTALDLGLPGLIAFIWLLLAFAYTCIHAFRLSASRQMQVLLVGLSASVLAFVAAGTIDLSTLGSKPIALLWGLFGLAAAVLELARKQADGDLVSPSKSRPNLWIFAIFLLILGATLILSPTSRSRNLGLIQAHKAIYQARDSGDLPLNQANQAIEALSNALDRDPDQAQLLGTRASLYAWQGNYNQALADLKARVRIDAIRPLATYAPYLAWKALLVSGDPVDQAQDLLTVYSHWLNRFPDRAESYILVKAVQQIIPDDQAPAAEWLERGIAKQAKPIGLLKAYQEQLNGLD